MRNPSRPRMARDRPSVRAAAWLMAILLWTSAGSHLLAESLGASDSRAVAMAGAGSIPTALPQALLGPVCDPGGPSTLAGKLPPADCVVCELLEAPTTATPPPAVAVPPSPALHEGGEPARWACHPAFREFQARAPPQA
jgi:hypothetical protein